MDRQALQQRVRSTYLVNSSLQRGGIMAYAEYPSTHYADTDAHELIHLYRELTDKYQGLLDKITELDTRFKAFEANVKEEAKKLVQNYITELDQKVTAKLDSVDARVDARVDTKFSTKWADLESEVDAKVAVWNEEVQGIISRMVSKQGELEEKVQKKMDDFDAWKLKQEGAMGQQLKDWQQKYDAYQSGLNAGLSTYLGKLKSDIDSYLDSTTQEWRYRLEELENKSNANFGGFVWNYAMVVGGITAYQWYKYTLYTCDMWNQSGISCYEWSMNSRKLLGYDKWDSRILNPLNGEMEFPEDVLVQFILEFANNGMTAIQYDKLGITAEEFDSWRIPAKKWDWRGGETDAMFRKDNESGTTPVSGE